MEFRIADTFTDSLARLTGDEQKAVKTTAFDLQLNPANPGMSFHKLDKAKDKNFWSVRVSSDIRLIVHKSDASLLLCYVDHHDKAYDWAERRKLETHPKTGAAQLVEIRETVKEIVVPVYVQIEIPATPQPAARKSAFSPKCPTTNCSATACPAEWLADVKTATEDTLLALTDHLPAEAAEALLELATGGKPRAPQPAVASGNPFEHPDALRRFRVMATSRNWQRALDFPWEKWTVFLHPEQRQLVERDYTGPARVSGSAGTGKTIVALHRAAHSGADEPRRAGLADDLLRHAGERAANQARDDCSATSRALRSGSTSIRSTPSASGSTKRTSARRRSPAATWSASSCKRPRAHVGGHKFALHFLLTEWEQVVDAWQLEDWEAYRDVVRLGRKTRLPEPQRKVLWSIFERVRAGLKSRGLITTRSSSARSPPRSRKPRTPVFDFAVVDEAQDITVAHVRFFAALGGETAAMLCSSPATSGSASSSSPSRGRRSGVDIRGRSRTLRVNYRTSHQIRTQADRLLGPSVTDVDGNAEDRSDTVSVFNGPPPIDSLAQERERGNRVRRRLARGTRQSGRRCRTNSACSSGRRRNWTAPAPPSRRRALRSRFSTSTSKPPAATSRSARCTWPRAWSFAPWP